MTKEISVRQHNRKGTEGVRQHNRTLSDVSMGKSQGNFERTNIRTIEIGWESNSGYSERITIECINLNKIDEYRVKADGVIINFDNAINIYEKNKRID